MIPDGSAVAPGFSRLAVHREAAGLTRRELARLADVPASSVRALEDGRLAPWGSWGWSEVALAVARCLTSTCTDVVAAAGCPFAACEELWPAFPRRPDPIPRPAGPPTPESICDAAERVRLLRSVLPELSAARRLVVTRYHGLDGEAPATLFDIARAHRVDYRTVVRTHRNALAQLREALARRGL